MPIPVSGRVAEALRRSTATVRSGASARAGSGSAIVLTQDTVVTNAHVVRSRSLQIESWDGKIVAASLVKVDGARDLALLHAEGLGAPPAQLGDSDLVRPGAIVIAVGNPLGFTGAVSSGVVHAVGAGTGVPAAAGLRWIYADVRLAPGNSGGPLADVHGAVIGVNTMVISGGLAMAIPSRAVELFLRRTQGRPGLGATVRFVRLKSGRSGFLILELIARGAAERGSLLPGDVLIGANERRIESFDDLEWALDGAASGGVLRIEFVRGGENKIRHVTLELPAEKAAAHAA